MRELPEQAERVETGLLRFGSDWCGVFIRGDNAYGFAGWLRVLLDGAAPAGARALAKAACGELLRLLDSCNETTMLPSADGSDGRRGDA